MTSPQNMGHEAKRRVKDGLERGLLEAARALEAEAAARAPIRDGLLRTNTSVTMVSDTSARVAFHQVYAARQHEETSWNHPKGGQAKYLESAANDLKHRLAATIANHVKGVIR